MVHVSVAPAAALAPSAYHAHLAFGPLSNLVCTLPNTNTFLRFCQHEVAYQSSTALCNSSALVSPCAAYPVLGSLFATSSLPGALANIPFDEHPSDVYSVCEFSLLKVSGRGRCACVWSLLAVSYTARLSPFAAFLSLFWHPQTLSPIALMQARVTRLHNTLLRASCG